MRGPKLIEGDITAVVETIEYFTALAGEGISREHLLSRLRLTHRLIGDSAMRLAIEAARTRGQLVIWDHHTRRYRMANSAHELEVWIEREAASRLKTFSGQIAAMRETAARSYPPQLRLAIAS